MRLLGCAILALLHVPYTALADGGFEDAAWSANAYCESWVSGFTDDTESNRLSAVAHLTPKGAGEPVLTARWVPDPLSALPPQQVIRAAREAGREATWRSDPYVTLPLTLLCRTTGFSGGIVDFRLELKREGQDPLVSEKLAAGDAGWERHVLAAPPGSEATRYTELTVTLTGRGNTTLCLCLLASSETPTGSALRGLADLYGLKGLSKPAAETWEQLAQEPASPGDRVGTRYAQIADDEGTGRAEYEKLWSELQGTLPLGDRWGERCGYRAARAMVDALPMTGYRLAETAGRDADGDNSAALAAGADGWPLAKVGVQACLSLAEAGLRSADARRALSLALRVLLRHPDCGAAQPTPRAHNAAYLDAANYLPTRDEVCSALSLALEACAESTAPGTLEDLAAQWFACELAAADWDLTTLTSLALSLRAPSGAAEMLRCVHVAAVLLRRGCFTAALRVAGLCSKSTAPVPLLRLHSRYLRGAALAACGRYFDAMDDLQAAAGAEDRWLSAVAALELAEAYEFTGRTAAAARRYGTVAAGGNWWWVRLRAATALRRLGRRTQDTSTDSADVPVIYLGEDRQTRGDWFRHFGSEAFCLCGCYAGSDLLGGPRYAQCGISKRTGLPEVPAPSWSSPSAAPDPSFLYIPDDDKWRATNWDDRGEAYAPGSGPDLCVDLTVPAGLHRLSLYFMNDCCNYEPGRDMTVEVQDREGRVLAATEVRHFLRGVYKQFAVRGPLDVTVRIHKNAGLNVLLQGLFLDAITPIPPPTPAGSTPDDVADIDLTTLARWSDTMAATGPGQDESLAAAWRRWQEAEAVHREPFEERARFRRYAEMLQAAIGPGPAAEALGSYAWDNLAEGRTWATTAALERRHALPAQPADGRALQADREDAALRLLRPVKVCAYGSESDCPAYSPLARETFAAILAALEDGEAVAYCHDFVAQHGWKQRRLVLQALGYLVDKAGAAELTNDELCIHVSRFAQPVDSLDLLKSELERSPQRARDLRVWRAFGGACVNGGNVDGIVWMTQRVATVAGNDDAVAQFLLGYAGILREMGACQEALATCRLLTGSFPRTRAALQGRRLRAQIVLEEHR